MRGIDFKVAAQAAGPVRTVPFVDLNQRYHRGAMTGHPVIASADEGERWLYGYPDDAFAEY